MALEIENQTDLSFEEAKLQEVAKAMSSKQIELIIVNSEIMAEINLEHRGINKNTDVLSFPIDDEAGGHLPLGSIIVSEKSIIDVCAELKHSIEVEMSILLVHGILHLQGYDHELPNNKMSQLESEWHQKLSLPDGLIHRTES